ncbi:hypothetical protein VCCP103710_2900, partial [Vibrio cholerae CP1037(10)]
MISVTVTSS